MGKLALGRSRAISKLLLPSLTALSRPQRAQALGSLAGLIFVEKFRSICEVAAFCGNGHTDRLHHLLSKAPLSAMSLQQTLHAPGELVRGPVGGLGAGRYSQPSPWQRHRGSGLASRRTAVD